jgi:FPC/CPF motif-containing protein YcgG
MASIIGDDLMPEEGEVRDLLAEWVGMPEYEHEDQTSYRQIIIHFKTPEDLARFEQLIGQRLGMKLKSTWYPEAEIGHYADKVYA